MSIFFTYRWLVALMKENPIITSGQLNITQKDFITTLTPEVLLWRSILDKSSFHRLYLKEGQSIDSQDLKLWTEAQNFFCIVTNRYEKKLQVILCKKKYLLDNSKHFLATFDHLNDFEENGFLAGISIAHTYENTLYIDFRAVHPSLRKKSLMTLMSYNLFAHIYRNLGNAVVTSTSVHLATFKFFNPFAPIDKLPPCNQEGEIEPRECSVELAKFLPLLAEKINLKLNQNSLSQNNYERKSRSLNLFYTKHHNNNEDLTHQFDEPPKRNDANIRW